MRTERNGLAGLGRGIAIALLALVATTGCGLTDQLPGVGGRVRDAPIVPPIPPPPDVAGPTAPIEGALWEVDGHPAAILDVRVVAGGRVAYLSEWADVGVLTARGDLASSPRFATQGWIASGLDAWREGPVLAAVTSVGIEVWDVDSGLPLAVLGDPWARLAVAPDGARIATPAVIDEALRVVVWDPLDGGMPRSIPLTGAVHALAWSPDGTRLAIASDEFLVVDDELQSVVWRADLDSADGASLRWHPELPLVAHAVGSTVTVFDVEAGTRSITALTQPVRTAHWADPEHLTLMARSGDVLSLAHATGLTTTVGSVPESTLGFEPLDDARAAIGTRSGSVGIWNFASGAPERLVAPAADRGTALAMSPDELRLVSGGHSGLLRTWRVADGALMGERLMGEWPIDELAWSPDGDAIAAMHSGRIELLDAATLAVLASSEGHYAGSLAFDPSGRLLVSSGHVLDGSTLEPISSPSTFGVAAAWGPDGTTIAVGIYEGDVHIHDASSSALIKSFPTGLETIVRTAWSPDGSVIAAADYVEMVAIDAATGERRYAIAIDGALTSLAFSADSTLLVTSGWASSFGGDRLETVRFWDAATGAPGAALGGWSVAGGFAVARDARHVALANWDGKVAYVEVPDAGP